MAEFKAASLFDLDHTLLKVNSSFAFGKYLKKHKVLSSARFFKLISVYLLHLLGFVSITALHHHAFKTFFYGRSCPDLKAYLDRFLEEHFDSMLNLPVIELLKHAQKEGHFVAVLSSSPDLMVEAVAQRLGIVHFVSSVYAVDSYEQFSHISKLVQGEDKAAWVAEAAHKFNIAKERITIYTDSILDLPFLLSGGIPIAVNPDKSLRKLSKKNGWQVVEA